MKRSAALIVLVGMVGNAALAAQAPMDEAAKFGALPSVYSVEISADGKRLAVVSPTGGSGGTRAAVIELEGGKVHEALSSNGDPLNLRYCQWSALDRLVCSVYGITRQNDTLLSFSRTLAVNADGKNVISLGQRDTFGQRRMRQHDGGVVDWMNGVDGTVLMARTNVPEQSTGSLNARTAEGLSVDLIDTRTGKGPPVERARRSAYNYISDGRGKVRTMSLVSTDQDGMLKGTVRHQYQTPEGEWKDLGTNDSDGNGITPMAVDPSINAVYVLKKLDGRAALYRIALDGSMKTELVFAHKQVDVAGVEVVGRNGRVIGAVYTTDRSFTEYFDPDYQKLAASLSRATKLPVIGFESASADEQVLVINASSDTAPGHYYVFDRTKRSLMEVLQDRPDLAGTKLSPMQAITYPAADGAQVPAYLTLPPGVTEAKGLPAIVMPHGGPSYRDSWGFDWLSQFFAQRGFVVLQPNFRGSDGYGDQWYMDNGFKSWKTSIGDVNDAGRWLVSQGMAAPSKLAIFGWSYGGYAALQANVLDPDLFKAVVAVAPVTDLALLKITESRYVNGRITADFIGAGPHVEEGSPAQNAAKFKAPVLMFQGENDLNVDVTQPKKMDAALRGAGKSTELVMYPKLEHSLVDPKVRADMLRRSDAFLRKHLGL